MFRAEWALRSADARYVDGGYAGRIGMQKNPLQEQVSADIGHDVFLPEQV